MHGSYARTASAVQYELSKARVATSPELSKARVASHRNRGKLVAVPFVSLQHGEAFAFARRRALACSNTVLGTQTAWVFGDARLRHHQPPARALRGQVLDVRRQRVRERDV